MGESASDIKTNIKKTRDKIGDTVSDLTGSTTESLTSVADKLSDTTEKLRTTVGNAAQAANTSVASLQERASDFAPLAADGSRNPLLFLAAGAIVGVAAGFLLPMSEIEKERLHPLGDEIVRRGVDARDEVLAQSKAIVTETVSAAKSSLKQHGREAAEHLGVSDATDAADESKIAS